MVVGRWPSDRERINVNEDYTSVDDVGIDHTVLLEVVGNGVLRKQRGLHGDFGADPFAFGMRLSGRVFFGAARAKLRAEGGFLDGIELLEVLPGFVADGAGNVDAESYGGHVAILNCGGCVVVTCGEKSLKRRGRGERPRRSQRKAGPRSGDTVGKLKRSGEAFNSGEKALNRKGRKERPQSARRNALSQSSKR